MRGIKREKEKTLYVKRHRVRNRKKKRHLSPFCLHSTASFCLPIIVLSSFSERAGHYFDFKSFFFFLVVAFLK